MTGTYRFQTGFYDLIDITTEFQRAKHNTRIGLKSTYCFLDDILTISKESEEDHKQQVIKSLKRLDEENL